VVYSGVTCFDIYPYFQLEEGSVVTFFSIIGSIDDNSNADVTTDEYHRYKVVDLIYSDRYHFAYQTLIIISVCF
jgi:hypothetical protein